MINGIKTDASKIILGTAQIGMPYGINNRWGKPSIPEAINILENAYEAGVGILDTALVYGEAFQIIGEYHRHHPEFKVNSKFRKSEVGNNLVDVVLLNLEMMGIRQLECLMFHHFTDSKDHAFNDMMRWLKSAGFAKKIGISIYTNEEFRRAIEDGTYDVIQFPFNLLDNERHREALMFLANGSGIELHARSVFLQGLLFMDPENIPEKLIGLKPDLAKIRELASISNIDICSIALGYVKSFPEINNILIGVETLSQLKTNIDCLKYEIPPQLKRQIGSINVLEKDLLNPVNW